MTAKRRKSRVTTTYRKSGVEKRMEAWARGMKRNAFWLGLLMGAGGMYWILEVM